MVKNSLYIKSKLLERYPKLNKSNIWLTDSEYLLPELYELEESINRNSVKNLKYNRNISECEEFSLFLHAAVNRERSENIDNISDNKKFTWAFGEVIGYKYSKLTGKSIHQMNICFTVEGLKIIEPQNDKIEDININKFNAFFVKM